MTTVHCTIEYLAELRSVIDRALVSLKALVGTSTPLANEEEAPPATLVARQQTNGTPVKPKAAPASATPQKPQTGSMAHQVAKVLKRKGPMSPREIRAVSDLTSSQVGYGLAALRQRKLVTAEGITNNRRYTLAPNFDVVWNGTKERNGEAPSLLAGRDSKGIPS